MARDLKITAVNNLCKIIIDGNEIKDVVSYKLEEAAGEFALLTVSVVITESLEMRN